MSTKNTLFRRFEFIGYSAIVTLLIGLAACGGGGDRAGIAGLIPGISLLAGNMDGWGSADGAGAAARLNYPAGMATDSAGNIYVADSNNHIVRKITPGGVMSTLAGLAGYSGSVDGAGSDARFYYPFGVAADSAGNVYVADSFNNKIRKITPSGVVSTFAGSGAASNVNATGILASFIVPYGVATDGAGNVYVADSGNNLIRVITPAGEVTTLAGSGAASNVNSTGTLASFNSPSGIATDSAGNVYVADTTNHLIRSISTTGSSVGVVTTLAGTANVASYVNASGTLASFNRPFAIATDNAGNVYVADTFNNAIRKISSATSGAASAVVTTLAGSGAVSYVDATGNLAGFNNPLGVAVDSAGNVFVGDYYNHVVRKIVASGAVSTLAGKVESLGSVDGSAAAAKFYAAQGVAADSAGNVYVADANNHTIRKITAAGLVSTFAGASSVYGNSDGQGTSASFGLPYGVTIDTNNNLYVADAGYGTIRKIPTTGNFVGVVSTFATGFSGPSSAAVDGVGNIYVADTSNNRIMKIQPNGTQSIFAGGGVGVNTDDKGTAASFNTPRAVATDSVGNVYVADTGNHTIRKITPDGNVSTLAGAVGIIGNTDGGGVARFYSPQGIVVAPSGNVYVADTNNHTIRKISPDGVVSTVVGIKGKGGFVEGGLPGTIVYPTGIALSGTSLYIATRNGVAVVRNLP